MQFSIRIFFISSLSYTIGMRHTPRQVASTGSPLILSALPPVPTSAAAILQQNAQCQLVSTALSICNSVTPGFNTMQPTKQARCLCYAQTTFIPNLFDIAVQTCADFASSAVPDAYSAIYGLEGFCRRNGNESE